MWTVTANGRWHEEPCQTLGMQGYRCTPPSLTDCSCRPGGRRCEGCIEKNEPVHGRTLNLPMGTPSVFLRIDGCGIVYIFCAREFQWEPMLHWISVQVKERCTWFLRRWKRYVFSRHALIRNRHARKMLMWSSKCRIPWALLVANVHLEQFMVDVIAWVVHRDVLMFQVLKLSELCRYQVFIILGVCVRAVSLREYFVPLLLRSYVEECSRLTTAPWVRAFITDIYDDLEFMLHWFGSRVEVRLEILSDVPAGSLF